VIVKKGIDDKQIEELILYSNNDELIEKYTKDKVRFKNKDAFKSWFDKGKEIYVLSDGKEKLLGIVWFSKKEMPVDIGEEYKTTFAIRIYGEGQRERFGIRIHE